MWVVFNTETAEIYNKFYLKKQAKVYKKYYVSKSQYKNTKIDKVDILRFDEWKMWITLQARRL